MILFKNLNQKGKATSKIKDKKVVSSSSLSGVGRTVPLNIDIGTVNLHATWGRYWVLYLSQRYFDSYGCSPPQKHSQFFIKRNGYCLYSDNKIQGLDSYCASFCSYQVHLTNVLGIDVKSAVLNLYYRSFCFH